MDITHDNVCSSMLSYFYSHLLSTGRPISSCLVERSCIMSKAQIREVSVRPRILKGKLGQGQDSSEMNWVSALSTGE